MKEHSMQVVWLLRIFTGGLYLDWVQYISVFLSLPCMLEPRATA